MNVRNRFSERVPVLVCFLGMESRAKQSMRAECDINNIMRQFAKTGTVSHMARYGGSYGEFTPMTYHEAMNTVRKSQEMFDALPGKIRRRFAGDPERFLDYVQDAANLEEMRELGLANPAEEAPSAPLAVPTPAAAAGPAGAALAAGAASTVVT